MTFNIQGWSKVSQSGNNDPCLLQDNTYVGAPDLYSYLHASDTVATMQGADYFADVANELNVGDIIFCTNVNTSETIVGTAQVTVSAVTVGPVASVTTTTSTSPGDVEGPASSTDNALVRFNGTDGKNIQDSSIIADDSDNVTGMNNLDLDGTLDVTGLGTFDASLGVTGTATVTGNLAVDNLDMNGNALTSTSGTVAITPLSGQDLDIVVDSGGEVNLTGAMQFNHTATENDDHALEIDCDAAGFSDVKAIDVFYDTGAIAATEEEAVMLINIDETASTGGDVAGLEILSTAEGSAEVYGVSGFVNVNPVLQSSGTFGNMDSALNIAVDVLAALSSGGAGNISGFVADDDTMTIGDAAKFEEMEWILGTGASGAGIAPTFEYSNGAGPTTFTSFGPIDGTNGMRNTGAIAWLVGDLPGWVVGDSGEFEIRITRTRNTLATTPIIDEVQIAATTEYKWDKDGDLTIGSVDIDASNAYSVAGTAILSDSAGTMTLSNIDALDATTTTTINSAVTHTGNNPNLLINSDFAVGQMGTSFTSATTPANSDDTYLFDQWLLLSDGNDAVDVSQETTLQPDGVGTAVKLDVETANKKFGLFQILENKRSVGAIGDTVSLSFDAQKVVGNATLETLRCAVVSWDSTADTVTSDIVSAWEAAGTDPTLVANWTYENTPANLTLTDSYQTFTALNISVDTASTTNIGVFIWVDDADATVGDLAYISKVKLEVGTTNTAYEFQPFDNALEECWRFLCKSFQYEVVPVQNLGVSTGELSWSTARGNAVSYSQAQRFPVEMAITPTKTLYNPAAANGEARDEIAAGDCSGTGASTTANKKSFYISTTGNASTVIGNLLGVHWLMAGQL